LEVVIKIEVKDNNVEQALRVLKRKLQRDGFFKIIKLKNTYEKPSEKKKRILQENIKRVLNDNGRIAISDIVSNKKVPLRLQNDHDLWTGCISGAWYEPDFISDFKELGFKNLEFAERSTEPWKVIEDIEFRTVTLVGNI